MTDVREDEHEEPEDDEDEGQPSWICPCGDINPLAKATCGDCGGPKKNRIA